MSQCRGYISHLIEALCLLILPALANSTSDFGSVAENNNVCLVKDEIYNSPYLEYFCNDAMTI